jgi:hypothetical protein
MEFFQISFPDHWYIEKLLIFNISFVSCYYAISMRSKILEVGLTSYHVQTGKVWFLPFLFLSLPFLSWLRILALYLIRVERVDTLALYLTLDKMVCFSFSPFNDVAISLTNIDFLKVCFFYSFLLVFSRIYHEWMLISLYASIQVIVWFLILNRYITRNDIEAVMKSHPTKMAQDQMDSLANSIKPLRKK